MISLEQLAEIAEIVKGIPVLGCRPGSPAAEVGIGYGDIVVAINGLPTPTLTAFLAARRLRTDGYEVKLVREGVERSVFVRFSPPTDVLDALALQLAHVGPLSPASADEPSRKPLPS